MAFERRRDREGVDKNLTQLIQRWTAGDAEALDQVLGLVYEELHRIAQAQMRRESKAQTLSATVLIHELYLELKQTHSLEFGDRYQFFAFAAKVMRHLVVRHARRRLSWKRGGEWMMESLQEGMVLQLQGQVTTEDLIAMGEALEALEKVDDRQTRIVELRFFAGLTHEEIAQAMSISLSTVKRELRTARMWLSRNLLPKDALLSSSS